MKPWIIVGQGLAGTCLAWQLHARGAAFEIIDSAAPGSSRVAAGLVNPITGKNFQPSADFAIRMPQAVAFYQHLHYTLGQRFWHPLPILRLAADEMEWGKIQPKLARPEIAPYIGGISPAPPPWFAAVVVKHGGRLDTRTFLDASRRFFHEHGHFREETIELSAATDRHIWCDGAAGLIGGHHGPHRCAKGEILTLEAPGWDQSHIRIGGGGWLVPIGGGHFKCGSTYQWEDLSPQPTDAALEKISSLARRLGGAEFTITAHEAGVRPILRRSEPYIGPWQHGWMFNGLGSKGSLHAPAIAALLAAWLLDGTEPGRTLDIRFRGNEP